MLNMWQGARLQTTAAFLEVTAVPFMDTRGHQLPERASASLTRHFRKWCHCQPMGARGAGAFLCQDGWWREKEVKRMCLHIYEEEEEKQGGERRWCREDEWGEVICKHLHAEHFTDSRAQKAQSNRLRSEVKLLQMQPNDPLQTLWLLQVNKSHNAEGAVSKEKSSQDTALQAVLIHEASLYCHHLGVDILPAVALLPPRPAPLAASLKKHTMWDEGLKLTAIQLLLPGNQHCNESILARYLLLLLFFFVVCAVWRPVTRQH